MEHRRSRNEFEARIDEKGNIAVPADVAQHFAGKRLRIHLSPHEINAELQRRMVGEEEIEEIARMQLEPREQVVRFLLTEGMLRKDAAFIRRIQRAKR
jgi:DNA-binding transcriptional regulator/RsmH inhibitor MraZ